MRQHGLLDCQLLDRTNRCHSASASGMRGQGLQPLFLVEIVLTLLLLRIQGTTQSIWTPQLFRQMPWRTSAAAESSLHTGDVDSVNPAKNKLAYVLLTNVGDFDRLTAILKQINTHLRPWTPGDLLVFHTGELSSDSQKEALRKAVQDVQIHQIPHHRWQLPKGLNESQRASWRSTKPVGYRHMCKWYSNGLFHYLKPLGYQWVWRLDEDSQIPEDVQYDVIDKLESDSQLYGFRAWASDNINVCWSLPEITAWYIVAHKLKSPWLLENCEPKTVAGLNSYGGWKARIIYNNLFIANIDFWLQPQVQHYLSVLESSHGHYLYRWGDAPVHTMVTGIFLAKDKVRQFDFPYCHKERCWQAGQL